MGNEQFEITERNITGDIQESRKSDYEQYGPEAFLAIIDDILDIEGVHSIRWRQYTPYFNDGEPCEFGINDLEVKLDSTPEDAGDWEDGYEDAWSLGYYADKEGRVLPEGLKDAMKKWDTSHFEAVALKNFGDHATVIATKAGFDVEFYDHE